MEANNVVLYFSIFVGACVFLWILFIIWSYNEISK